MAKRHFQYLEFGDKRLFACKIIPEKSKQISILMCYPFGHDFLISQRVYYNFARYLAENGCTVYLFDYMGYGDSSHSFEDSSPSTIILDIESVIEHILENNPGGHKLGLFGMTLGGSWALMASLNIKVDFLILWSPVIDLGNYIYTELRKSISAQTTILKKVVFTREEIKERLINDQSLIVDGFVINNIDGYIINKKYITQIDNINLISEAEKITAPILLIDIKTRNAHLSKEYLKIISIVTEKFPKSEALLYIGDSIPWKEGKYYDMNPSKLFEVSVKFFNMI